MACPVCGKKISWCSCTPRELEMTEELEEASDDLEQCKAELARYKVTVAAVRKAVRELSEIAQSNMADHCRGTPGICFCGFHGFCETD